MADLYALTEDVLKSMDLELIDVERAAMGLLRVTIDKKEGVHIKDCEQASRQLSRVYEVENIEYQRLEVSSPGVDRPLRSASDFMSFSGQRIQIKLREAIDGRKVFSGTLRVPTTQTQIQPEVCVQDSKAVFGLEFEATKKEAVQVLRFTLDDIERAKLDPVLDFKGKKR